MLENQIYTKISIMYSPWKQTEVNETVFLSFFPVCKVSDNQEA